MSSKDRPSYDKLSQMLNDEFDKVVAQIKVPAIEDAESAVVEEKQTYDILKIQQEIEDLKSSRRIREEYAKKIYEFVGAWSCCVLFIVILQGFNFAGFKLDTSAMVTLLGTTAVSALGLILAIVKGLFR